jgi:hypothetical protein
MNRGVALFPLAAVHEADSAKCGFALDLDVGFLRVGRLTLHFTEHDLQNLLDHVWQQDLYQAVSSVPLLLRPGFSGRESPWLNASYPALLVRNQRNCHSRKFLRNGHQEPLIAVRLLGHDSLPTKWRCSAILGRRSKKGAEAPFRSEKPFLGEADDVAARDDQVRILRTPRILLARREGVLIRALSPQS